MRRTVHGVVLALLCCVPSVSFADAAAPAALREGDLAAYDVFEWRNATWEPLRQEALSVGPLHVGPDAQARARPLLPVDWTSSVGIRLVDGFDAVPAHLILQFDTATRTLARRDVLADALDEKKPTLVSSFGPDFDLEAFTLYALQLYGADVGAWLVDLARHAGRSCAAWDGACTDLDDATLAGRRVHGQRLAATLPPVHQAPYIGKRNGDEILPSDAVGTERHARFEAWWSDEAFPARVEVGFDDGPRRLLYQRAAFTAGRGAAIVWGDEPPLPTRLPGAAHDVFPADGDGLRFPRSLEAALAAAYTEPRNAPFQAWLRLHPDALFVAAAGTGLTDPPRWGLLFADPPAGVAFKVIEADGDAVEATLGQSGSPGPNMNFQSVSFLPFSPDIQTTQHLSLADGERLWMDYFAATAGPDYLHWANGSPRYALNDTGFTGGETDNSTATSEYIVQREDILLVGNGPFDLQLAQHLRRLVLNGFDEPRTQAVFVDTANATLRLAVQGYDDIGVVAASQDYFDDWLVGVAHAVSPAPPPASVGAAPQALELGAGIAAASLFAVVIAYLWPLLRFWATAGFVAGYSRILGPKALDQSVRARLAELIAADPGVSPPQLQRLVGCGWSTAVYHLRVLERNGVVTSLIDGRHKRFFPVGDVDAKKFAPLAALRNAKTKEIWDLLRAQPGLARKEIARRMGFSVPAAVWHLERLQRVGLVGEDRLGRRMAYYGLDMPPSPPSTADVT